MNPLPQGRTLSAGALLHRPAAERFHSRTDWLDSWHRFSFGAHHDPQWMGFGPLRVINDDRIAAGRCFGLHPHRDMEIITVMVEGQINHRDSLGHAEVLREGEVQRMSAGTGVMHSEINEGERPCRLLQIWIEPTSLGIAPTYEQRPFAIGEDWTPLLDPEHADGAMAIHRPMRLWRAQPPAGRELALPLGSGSRGWIQLISGAGDVDGCALVQGDGLGFGAGAVTRFKAGASGADLLLFELR
ncbi:MAG: pirin family protein [Synechococcaceae cyanobacterium]|nr:pirin family protein [Synechococcaceae cyanobacterium]